MSDNATIRLMPVRDLLDKQFVIPKYQRGYRWGRQEIRELLDDIYDYARRADAAGSHGGEGVQVGDFYCLQPIVVKKNGERYDVIDGQQRLTSIYLLLTYLWKYPRCRKLYSIKFESRQSCEDFLTQERFAKDEENDSNIDLYHMSKCYKYIDEWFTKDMNHVESCDKKLILKTLLARSKNVQVLWYEITSNEDPISIFSRLNIGKIPLTDAELIKALLLQGDCYRAGQELYVKQQLFEIASEWNMMEVALQDENLWYFLNDANYKPSSRIELLFKILAESWNGKVEHKERVEANSRNFAYLVFDKYLAKKRKEHEGSENPLAAVKDVWKEIQELYGILLEWYNDKELYHYIGFLLFAFNSPRGECTIKKFCDEYMDENPTKETFKASLLKRIAKTICCCEKGDGQSASPGGKKSICECTYSDNPKLVIDFLLLFNIDAALKLPDESARFPFGLFKQKNATSIEHIHPQNPPSISKDNVEMRREWLISTKTYLDNIRQEAQSADAKKTGTDEEEQLNTAHREVPVADAESWVSQLEALQKNVDDVLHKKGFEGFEKLQESVLTFCENLADPEMKTDFLPNLALLTKETNSSLNNGFFNEKRQRIQQSPDYIPLCTERVFNKYYTQSPASMYLWNATDRTAYAEALIETYTEYTAPVADSAQPATSEESANA
ncbi:DUF262 domain-containing protein [Desulfovibrio sp. OttesenSCG-928-O18]|nr:DUF262 domain-containing protein [Desulfovibrio sp. OttesenSCG-928-O18]